MSWKGEPAVYARYEYFMLNKPSGVVSATEDKKEKTVLDLLRSDKSSDAGTGMRREDLFPVGRLDKDTEGLLLITNDGDLAHRLLSPKKHVDKVYYADIRGKVDEEDVRMFAQGLDIGDEKATLPAELKILSSGETSRIEVTLREGRYHQVKRMFRAVGKEVIYLKRLSMGSLALDEALAPGEFRRLTDEEVDKIMLKGKKAVIFDMDGSLVDSMWVWLEVDRIYMAKHNITEPETFHKDIEGMSYIETAQYFVDTFQTLNRTREEVMQDWRDMAE